MYYIKQSMSNTEKRDSQTSNIHENYNKSPPIEIYSENKNLDIKPLKNSDIERNDQEIMEKCNGCFNQLGSIYCLNCEKTFCKECDIQAHILPAYIKHER